MTDLTADNKTANSASADWQAAVAADPVLQSTLTALRDVQQQLSAVDPDSKAGKKEKTRLQNKLTRIKKSLASAAPCVEALSAAEQLFERGEVSQALNFASEAVARNPTSSSPSDFRPLELKTRCLLLCTLLAQAADDADELVKCAFAHFLLDCS